MATERVNPKKYMHLFDITDDLFSAARKVRVERRRVGDSMHYNMRAKELLHAIHLTKYVDEL